MSELLLLLILALIFIFTPNTYIGSKYRLSVYLICNNLYRHRPWKTHIGRPLIKGSLIRIPRVTQWAIRLNDPSNGLKNDALHVKSPFVGSYARKSNPFWLSALNWLRQYRLMWSQAYTWENGNVLFFIVLRLIQEGNAKGEPLILRGNESFHVKYSWVYYTQSETPWHSFVWRKMWVI